MSFDESSAFQLPPLLRMVISGGQSGADRAALEAARDLGINTGGWAPESFKTTSGTDLSLRDTFKLKELKASGLVPLFYFAVTSITSFVQALTTNHRYWSLIFKGQ